MSTRSFALILTAVATLAPARASAQTPAGMWDATVTLTLPNNGGTNEIPFRFEIVCGGASCASPKGSFFNGDERVTSTAGSFAGGALQFTYPEYGSGLDGRLKAGKLQGQ